MGWWAVSDGSVLTIGDKQYQTIKGDLIRIAEYYGCTGEPNVGLKITAAQVAKNIVEKEEAMGIRERTLAGPADSSIFNIEDGHSINDGFQDNKVYWEHANKSKGSRKNGWETMRTLFDNALPKFDEEILLPREYPAMYIVNTCRDFIRTMPSLPRDNRDMDDVDTDAEDHIADEARYMATFVVHDSTQRAF